MNEATARIKINKLLEEAGWRFFAEDGKPANILLKLHFIQPGKPTQNAFVESFNARFRDTCLNQHWFRDVQDARQIITAWRDHYNHVRPHSSLGYIPPAVFAQQAA